MRRKAPRHVGSVPLVRFGPTGASRQVARPDRSHDSQVKRGSTAEFDRAVRNTYKVLLTRGMRGTTVLSTDPETQQLLESLIG